MLLTGERSDMTMQSFAGLRKGDVIDAINGKALNGDPPLNKAAAAELLKTPNGPSY